MTLRLRRFLLISLALAQLSCASGLRKEQEQVRSLYSQKDYAKALDFLKESKLKQDPENRLLYLMLKGRLEFLLKDYSTAARTFDEANQLVDRLYTKSVKETLLSGVLNENVKTFYARPYERSLLFHYQAMSFFLMSQSGELSSEERKSIRSRAKAVMLAWDTFIKDLSRSSREETIFDDSLSARLMAAKVHELLNTRSDRRVALQLYKDALVLLRQRAGAYASFSSDYEKHLEALLESKKDKIEPELLTSTYRELEKFLQVKIASLGKTSNSKSKEVTTQVTLFYESELLPSIKPQYIRMNLNTILKQSKDPVLRREVELSGIGALDNARAGRLAQGALMLELIMQAGVEFEVGQIPAPLAAQELLQVEVQKKKAEEYVNYGQNNLVPVIPLSDMAYFMEKERSRNYALKKGARIALKYIVAIIAAQKSYEMFKKNNDESHARMMALGQYILSSRLIGLSEKADVRQWVNLPANVYLSEFNLLPGDYRFRFYLEGQQDNKTALGPWREVKVPETNEAIFSFTD